MKIKRIYSILVVVMMFFLPVFIKQTQVIKHINNNYNQAENSKRNWMIWLERLFNDSKVILNKKSQELLVQKDRESIIQALYIQQVIRFLTEKKSLIQVFKPLLLQLLDQKKFIRGTTTWNQNKTENIFAVQNDPYDLLLKQFEMIKILKSPPTEIINTLSMQELEAFENKYFADLRKELGSILANQQDLLKSEQVELTFDHNNQISLHPIQKQNLENYIKSKITLRFLEFDLKQNQQLLQKLSSKVKEGFQPNPNDKEQKQEEKVLDQNPKNKEPNQTTPTSSSKNDSIDANALMLNPILRAKAYGKKWQSGFLGTDNYFFANPINTRYQYQVIGYSTNQLLIEIRDNQDETISKKYTSHKLIVFSQAQQAQAYENAYLELEKLFARFYYVFKIDKTTLDLSGLANKKISDVVFEMINIAASNVADEKFEKKIQTHVLKYMNQQELLNQNVLNDFLTSLKYPILQNNKQEPSFWLRLVGVYEEVFADFLTTIKQKLTTIPNQTAQLLEKGLAYLKEQIERFKLLAVLPFNLLANYESLIMIIKQIQAQLDSFKQSAQNNFSSFRGVIMDLNRTQYGFLTPLLGGLSAFVVFVFVVLGFSVVYVKKRKYATK